MGFMRNSIDVSGSFQVHSKGYQGCFWAVSWRFRRGLEEERLREDFGGLQRRFRGFQGRL